MEILQKIVGRLREELKRSNSECLFLIQELENKEVELHNSSLCIENLRESMSSITLDSQCEIESMKLDIVEKVEKVQEEAIQEKTRMSQLIQELEVQFQDAQNIIEQLELENKALRERFETSQTNFRMFWQKLEKWFAKDASQVNTKPLFDELERKFAVSEEMRYLIITF